MAVSGSSALSHWPTSCCFGYCSYYGVLKWSRVHPPTLFFFTIALTVTVSVGIFLNQFWNKLACICTALRWDFGRNCRGECGTKGIWTRFNLQVLEHSLLFHLSGSSFNFTQPFCFYRWVEFRKYSVTTKNRVQ